MHTHHPPTKTLRRRPAEKRSALRGRKKKAKAKLKGKGKKPAPSSLRDQPCQDCVLFNEAVKLRAEVVLKSTEETTKSVEAKKEQTRMEKYQTYLKLLDKDTANFSDAKLKRHEAVLEKLATELAEEQMIPNLCLYP